MPRVYNARERRFRGYLEDDEPGDIFHHWPGHTITEAGDHMFCLLTLSSAPGRPFGADTDDDLGGAASDVDHQVLTIGDGDTAERTEMDQPGLLYA